MCNNITQYILSLKAKLRQILSNLYIAFHKLKKPLIEVHGQLR